MSSRLTLPARKMLVEHLCSASVLGINNEIKQWTVFKDCFSVVWLQGTVQEVNEQSDSFQLDDGSGVAMVTKVSTVHPGCPKPVSGAYMIVIGELSQVGAIPEIRAMKFHDLTPQKKLYQLLWPSEVKDLHKFLHLTS